MPWLGSGELVIGSSLTFVRSSSCRKVTRPIQSIISHGFRLFSCTTQTTKPRAISNALQRAFSPPRARSLEDLHPALHRYARSRASPCGYRLLPRSLAAKFSSTSKSSPALESTSHVGRRRSGPPTQTLSKHCYHWDAGHGQKHSRTASHRIKPRTVTTPQCGRNRQGEEIVRELRPGMADLYRR